MAKFALIALFHLLAATYSIADLSPQPSPSSVSDAPYSPPTPVVEDPNDLTDQRANRDACGPVVQPSAAPSYQPDDTCITSVTQSNSPATYGVLVDNNGDFTFSDPTGPKVATSFVGDCTAAFMSTICGSLPAQGAGAAQWVWAANGACTIGYWMSADPAAAPPPASDHCVKGILTPMASILNPVANEGANNRASININQNFPGNQLHGGCNFEYGQSCTGSADGGMGTQVNAGYMSWIMQPNLQDDIWGGKPPTSFCKCTCFTNSTIIPLDAPSSANRPYTDHGNSRRTSDFLFSPWRQHAGLSGRDDNDNAQEPVEGSPSGDNDDSDDNKHKGGNNDKIDDGKKDGSEDGRKEYRAGNCNDCNRQFCLDYNLPICKKASMDDVFTTCFQRDSRKDEAVVFVFIAATVGLLGWAAVRPWVAKWYEKARERRDYIPVAAGDH